MNVAGALHEAGPSPLRDYSWGETVVGIVNAALPADKAVTVDNSGYEVKDRLELLENARNHAIMSISLRAFDMSTKVTDSAFAKEISGGRRAEDPGTTAEKDSQRSTVSVIAASGLVVIAIIVALAYSSIAVKTGEMPDTGMLESIVKIIYELVTQQPAPGAE